MDLKFSQMTRQAVLGSVKGTLPMPVASNLAKPSQNNEAQPVPGGFSNLAQRQD
jgi:hypothetical protein